MIASDEFLWHDQFGCPVFRAKVPLDTDDRYRLDPSILPVSVIFLKRVRIQFIGNPKMTQNWYH
jgi:hypothetical protein